MNRNFSESELADVIKISLRVNDNALPYLCKENSDCWFSIECFYEAVKRHNIVPEQYWHGNSFEFISDWSCQYQLTQINTRK